MKTSLRFVFVVACSSSLLACGGGGEETVDAGLDGPPPVPACSYDEAPEELALPFATIEGALTGESQNPSTTCTRQQGTGGPERVYLFRLAERRVVTLQVFSDFDTVLALRKTCDEPLTEVACADGPLPTPGGGPGPVFDAGIAVPGTPLPGVAFSSVDAGVFVPPVDLPLPADAGAAPLPPDDVPPSGNPLDASLRIALDPGVYFVIVDEAAPFGVGGAFTLVARSEPPPASASCRTASAVANGTVLSDSLDFAAELPPACAGEAPTPALFYSATIPSGERLKVNAVAIAGDGPWRPVLTAFSACDDGLCLGAGQLGPNGDEALEYVNNGPAPITIVFAVSSDTRVAGASFSLRVRISAPLVNTTCAAAMPVKDGTRLLAQDLGEGGQSSGFCAPPGPSLFYKADLLPGQTLHVTATSPVPLPASITIMSACSGTCLQGGGFGGVTSYTNASNARQSVLIQVSTFQGIPSALVDINVALPLPPGGVKVSPRNASATSEAGGMSTFTVVLTSPPLADVVVPIESLDAGEVAAAPAMLVFTAANWDQPQTVTLTGVDDAEKDGTQVVTIAVKPAGSADVRYQGVDGLDVMVRNLDDDPGVTLDGAESLVTTEGGRSDSFRVRLNRAPTAPVTVPLSSDDGSEGEVTPAQLVFTPQDWNVAQTVTVAGVDDADKDGAQTYKVLVGALLSDDADFAGVDPADVDVVNRDDDFDAIAAYPLDVGNRSCGIFSASKRRIAIDEGGTIYVLLACHSNGGGFPVFDGGVSVDGGFVGMLPPPPVPVDGGVAFSSQVFVVTSRDGGKSFGAPVATGLPGDHSVSIAAGASGQVFVAAAGSTGLLIARSTDHGGHFQPPAPVGDERFAGAVDLSVAGSTVVVAAVGGQGGVSYTNQAGGEGAFTQVRPGFGGDFFVQAMPDARKVWLFSTETGTVTVRGSDNAGVSFETTRRFDDIKFDGGSAAFGQTVAFFATFDRVVSVSLSDWQTRQLVQQDLANRQVILDEFDNLTLLEGVGGRLVARRLDAGAQQFGATRELAPFTQGAYGAALAETAVAVVYIDQFGRSWFTLTTF